MKEPGRSAAAPVGEMLHAARILRLRELQVRHRVQLPERRRLAALLAPRERRDPAVGDNWPFSLHSSSNWFFDLERRRFEKRRRLSAVSVIPQLASWYRAPPFRCSWSLCAGLMTKSSPIHV